jgi:antitoxin HicB
MAKVCRTNTDLTDDQERWAHKHRRQRVSPKPHTHLIVKRSGRLSVAPDFGNLVQLARKLGCDGKEVRRMLNPRHPTKLPRIKDALDVLGKRLVVSVEEAA